VRFNGRKVWIKIAAQYKNGQCGLCGHYDGESQNEWRMNNNEETDDLAQFHRSYSLQQDEDCSAAEQNEFYQQNKMFKKQRSSSMADSSSSSSESNENDDDDQDENEYNKNRSDDEDNQQNDWDNEWDNENFEGNNYNEFKRRQNNNKNSRWGKNSYRQQWNNNQNQNGNCLFGNCRSKQQQKPTQQTAVMEVGSSKICFSMEPVKQCPRGTYPTSSSSNNQNCDCDGQKNGNKKDQKKNCNCDDNNQDYQNQKTIPKKVKFACLNRSSSEARQLLNEARRGQVLDMATHQPSLTETVQQPTKCASY
jgi:hypothetical protein